MTGPLATIRARQDQAIGVALPRHVTVGLRSRVYRGERIIEAMTGS
ncbi:MAG: hypothetical protein AAF213_01625 [Pseudomonadota bacterium]